MQFTYDGIESWKEIPGYEGIYEISDLGRIRSINRTKVDRNGKLSRYQGQIMTTTRKAGRPSTCILTSKGDRKCEKVGELVLKTFVGRRAQGHTISYLDGNNTNDKLENLEWSYDLKG